MFRFFRVIATAAVFVAFFSAYAQVAANQKATDQFAYMNGSNSIIVATKADFESSSVKSSTRTVSLDSVLPATAGQRRCPLSYARGTSSPTGVYGEVFNSGAYWEPLYSTAPVQTCEFGALGDAVIPRGSNTATFIGSSTGGKVLTTSSTSGLAVGMQVANLNWATFGELAIPAGTTITSIVTDLRVTVSNDIPSWTNLRLVAWMPLDAKTVTGTDATNAIQAAIDYALANGHAEVQIADGQYKISNTLHLNYGDRFRSIRLVGERRAHFAPGGVGVALAFVATDRPAINVQGARNASISGLAIYGPNYNYVIVSQLRNNTLSSNEADWLAPELARSGAQSGGLQKHSPLAGVTIDAFSGPVPSDAYPGVVYPAFTGINDQYNKKLTSDVTIEECNIQGFAVAIASGLNTNYQGDFIRVRGGQIVNNIYGVAVQNAQSRNVETRDIVFSGLFTALTNSKFGMQIGEWNGPIDNLALSSVYQIFGFGALSYSGPLTIRNIYCEGCVRIGVLYGGASFNPTVVFDGGLLLMSDTTHSHIPASFITSGGSQTIIFRGTQIVSNTRLQTLLVGGSTRLICEGCVWQMSARSAGTSWRQAAFNFSGGLVVGTPRFNTVGVDRTRFVHSFGTYFTTPSSPITSVYLDDSLQFEGPSGYTARALISQAAKRFTDRGGREWRVNVPAAIGFQMGNLAQVAYYGAPAWSDDVMTFTMTSGFYNSMSNKIAPGWIIFHLNTGTLFVVIGVGSVDSSGNVPIESEQQNNLMLDSSTRFFASNSLTDKALSGYCMLIAPGVFVPHQVEFGTFTSGSTTVTNVSSGDGSAGDLAKWLVAGDPLFGPRFSDAYAPWPISGMNEIAITTPGSPGSIALKRSATVSGRFPIFPVPIY